MQVITAILIALACSGTGMASSIFLFESEPLDLLPAVCPVEVNLKQPDPCATVEERCDKAAALDVEGCETHTQDPLLVTVNLTGNVLARGVRVHTGSEAPELPSFILVGAGLVALRFRKRRTG